MANRTRKNRPKKSMLAEAEVEFAVPGSKADYRRRQKALANKELRQIAPKLYTRNFDDSPQVIVRKNWKEILGYLYPGAIVSHRTAMDLKPSTEGYVHLTYTYTKKRRLPGLTVFLTEGPKSQSDDLLLPGGLYLSSETRKALENLESHQARTKKTVPRADLEIWLDMLLNVRGEKGLNDLRDRANEIAGSHWGVEKKKLKGIVGALLKTRPQNTLVSEVGKRRALGLPYDVGRNDLFDILFTHLTKEVTAQLELPEFNLPRHQAFAFFESYFSNFIEGTEFEIDEAKEIVFDGKIPNNRPKDGHDILGVYLLAADKNDIKTVPADEEQLIALLKARHHKMFNARPEVRGGEFKERRNKAGDTHFVEPALVKGTLCKGYEFYRALPAGFARAAFMMFLISEVHPFDDGNGRVARLMMNAELSRASTFRILIPIVYREDYLLSLRKLSRQRDPSAYVKMLYKAYSFASLLRFKNVDDMERALAACDAFKEPQGNVLKLPSSTA